MDSRTIAKGDLFFLMHGDTTVFSGYGLALAAGSKQQLVGMLLVDRPQRASPAWLAEVRNAFGPFDLYPMTTAGERGLNCQMWVEPDSLVYVRSMVSPLAQQLQETLFPLLHRPPAPHFVVRWDPSVQAWRSVLRTEAGATGSRKSRFLFALGTIVATPGALAALEEAGQIPQEFLHRHVQGDWGDVDPEDWQANDRALQHGLRLLSAYTTKKGVRIWIISEWDRSVTTLLLPAEY